jgi:hypothetical protein
LISGGAYGALVPDGGATDAKTTELYTVLCKADTALCKATMHLACIMPQSCGYSFTSADLTRIEAWIQAGAPNN